VIYDKIKFPLYVSQNNYVILEFAKKPEDLEFYSINPQSEINIQPKDQKTLQIPQKQKKNDTFLCKVYKLPENSGFLENFAYIHAKNFEKFNLNSNKPYSLNYKLIKHRNSLFSLSNYLRKLENLSKKDAKKTIKNFYIYIKPLPEDFFTKNPEFQPLEYENYLYFSSIFIKTLSIQPFLPIKLDFSLKITDFSKQKFCNILDFANPKLLRYNVYFFPIASINPNEELFKQEFSSYLFENFLEKNTIVLYSSQLLNFKGNFFAIKILENSPDKKNLLEMLTFEEKRSETRITSEEGKKVMKFAQEKLIIAKTQDFINNFPEKTINSYSIFAKKHLFPKDSAIKLNFVHILFTNLLEEMRKSLHEFFENSQQFMCNFNAFLLTGGSGNGKKSLIKRLKSSLKTVNFEKIDFNEITNIKNSNVPPLDVIRSFIEGKIQGGCLKGRTVMVLDHLHLAAKNIERIDFQQSHEILLAEVFGKFVKDLMKKYKNVAFIALCENKELLNKQFNGKVFL